MVKTRILVLWSALTLSFYLYADIDMQAHVSSDDGLEAYTEYVEKQATYYTDIYAPEELRALRGAALFERLNTLMGATNKIDTDHEKYSYNAIRWKYITVEKDLNNAGSNIIGFYNGKSFSGSWDFGNTWNREHVWPQSKGASSAEAMGYDIQSVRPALVELNEDHKNYAYGESSGCYNPSLAIDNPPYYKDYHLGSYKGDVARILMYDFITYGSMSGHQNALYNGKAQLLNKLSASGVIESLAILLKWHMQDPPSLTEMVRNDVAAAWQGNRNPFIDYPELATLLFSSNGARMYTITYDMAETASPNYILSTSEGFITYLTYEGQHPTEVTVTGGLGYYDEELGRLKVTNVRGNITITTSTPKPEPDPDSGVEEIFESGKWKVESGKILLDGHLYIRRGNTLYTPQGTRVR